MLLRALNSRLPWAMVVAEATVKSVRVEERAPTITKGMAKRLLLPPQTAKSNK